MTIDEVLAWIGLLFGLGGIGINGGWVLVEFIGVCVATVLVLCVGMGLLDVFMRVVSSGVK